MGSEGILVSLQRVLETNSSKYSSCSQRVEEVVLARPAGPAKGRLGGSKSDLLLPYTYVPAALKASFFLYKESLRPIPANLLLLRKELKRLPLPGQRDLQK